MLSVVKKNAIIAKKNSIIGIMQAILISKHQENNVKNAESILLDLARFRFEKGKYSISLANKNNRISNVYFHRMGRT